MADAPSTHPSLLRRLRDLRDREGWALFVEAYAPAVYQYAREQGLQDADAADVTQEVLRSIVRAMERFVYDPKAGTFRGWLFTLARRRVADFMRERVAAPVGADDSLLQNVLSPNAEDESRWEDSIRGRLLAVAMRQVQVDVSPTTWQAFELTAIKERKGKQVASELGLSVAAVYLARSRVVARLKEIVHQLENPS